LWHIHPCGWYCSTWILSCVCYIKKCKGIFSKKNYVVWAEKKLRKIHWDKNSTYIICKTGQFHEICGVVIKKFLKNCPFCLKYHLVKKLFTAMEIINFLRLVVQVVNFGCFYIPVPEH